MTYPAITWSRGVVTSALLHRTKVDLVLVGEVTDTGDDTGRYLARWLGGGEQDRESFGTLGEARAWVVGQVAARMGVSL